MANASAVPVSGPKLDNRRVIAALIDLAIVIAGAAVIVAVAGVSSASEIPASLDAVILGWALYYYFACESSESAQTVGKRVMKIRVVRMDGSATDMREIAVRTVLRVIDGIFFYLVGLIVMLATGERRGRLGDLAAGTKVVSADAPARAQAAAPAAAQSEAPRVPIAESGPVFAEPAEAETVDVASPALKELAEDVEATAGSAPDEAPQPVPDLPEEEEPADDELAPAAEADEPVVEVAPEPEAGADELVVEVASQPEPEPEAEVAPEPAAEAEVEEPAAEVEEPAVEVEPVVEVEEPAAEAEEPAAEVEEPAAEVEPVVEVEEPPVEAEAVEDEVEAEAHEADADDEPEDDPLADASHDELDEAEIAAAVEAELNGESSTKARRRSSARAKR
ncbi:MAG TPA: RDD family protein [Thermoleophilaceae bacterium]|nr:RDD family protein [Thermoleophilaceae bacterium]